MFEVHTTVIKCTICGVELGIGTGSWELNLQRHCDSVVHLRAVNTKATHKPLASYGFNKYETPPTADQPQFFNATLRICPGYQATSVKYVSKRYGTVAYRNPMSLIFDLHLPLPAIGTGSKDSPVDLSGATPDWIPFPLGLPGHWSRAHFRSKKCQGVVLETRRSTRQLAPVTLHATCEHCRAIPHLDTFRMRLYRDASRVADGGVERGARNGPQAVTYPNLPELVDVSQALVLAFRKERRKSLYFMSRSRTLEAKFKQLRLGSPEVCLFVCCGVLHELSAVFFHAGVYPYTGSNGDTWRC